MDVNCGKFKLVKHNIFMRNALYNWGIVILWLYRLPMDKNIENLDLTFMSSRINDTEWFYVDDHLYLSLHAAKFGQQHLQFLQPYRVEEERLLFITRGVTRIVLNLEEHQLAANDILVIAPGTVVEIMDYSPDISMMAMSMKDLISIAHSDHNLLFKADDEMNQLVCDYFQLLWQVVCRKPILYEAVTMLQSALMLEVKRVGRERELKREQSLSRQHNILRSFLTLVNQHGMTERHIGFYADKLCVTPNHLSVVVKKASGLTIMQWLNRYVIQHAKLKLRYSDKPVWEIAEEMNFANASFFSKFFKKETGITPSEYREKG